MHNPSSYSTKKAKQSNLLISLCNQRYKLVLRKNYLWYKLLLSEIAQEMRENPCCDLETKDHKLFVLGVIIT